MKAFDANVHKMYLTSVLLDIYKNPYLSNSLGFKGGTAAMLFYGLPRFSVDLDFDLTLPILPGSDEAQKIVSTLTEMLGSRFKLKDQSLKFNTLFWAVSYGEGTKLIKVEVSTRKQPHNAYDLIPFYGITVKVTQIRDMIAHKMIAILERKTLANRDIFDTHYFLSSNYAVDINYKIVKDRLNLSPEDFYTTLLKFLESMSSRNLLEGLGELVNEKQKYWVKNKMLGELKGLIQRQLELKTF